MAANTSPIFPVSPASGSVKLSTSAVTGTDGTDGNVATVFTAGVNGSKIEEITIQHLGTNVASVVRFWVNNGNTAGTATNNTLWYEVTMAANTLSQTAASIPIVIRPPSLFLKAGYKLLAAAGTAVAAGHQVTALGGDY